MKEQEIQNWLTDVIFKEKLYEVIEGKEEVYKVKSMIERDDFIPSLVLDYLLRKRYVLSAYRILNSLSSVKIITDSSQNISVDRSERLFSDVILFDEETAKLIIIEIKRNKKTARETVTELLAYEQEVKNQFPFLSSNDIYLIIVSTEYSDLLSHSISNLIMSDSRQVLCLEVGFLSEFYLKVHIPNSWTSIEGDRFPPDTISSIALYLYPNSKTPKSNEHLENILSTASDLIIRKGEKTQSHGFLLLWENSLKVGKEWGFTIGLLNPYLFRPFFGSESVTKKAPLLEYFSKKEISDQMIWSFGDFGFICKDAINLLSEYFDPVFERHTTWSCERRSIENASPVFSMQMSTNPKFIDFWGILGEFSRDLILNKAFRKNFIPAVSIEKLSWKSPLIGLSILDDLISYKLFKGGIFSCGDLFKVGMIIGRILFLCDMHKLAPESDQKMISAYLNWSLVELIPATAELNQRYLIMSRPCLPPPQIVFTELKEKISKSLELFVDWMIKEFLDKHKEHLISFDLGLKSFIILDPYVKLRAMESQVTEVKKIIIASSKVLLELFAGRIFSPLSSVDERKKVLQLFSQSYFCGQLVKKKNQLFSLVKNISKELHLKFLDSYLMNIADLCVGDIMHERDTMSGLPIDCAWFKQRVLEMRRKGIENIVIMKKPSGEFGLCSYSEMKILKYRKPNLDEEVPFIEQFPGGNTIERIMTWKELESLCE